MQPISSSDYISWPLDCLCSFRYLLEEPKNQYMEDVLLELQKSVLKKKKKRRNRIAYSSLSRWESASYDGLRWLRLLVLLILDEQQQIALFLLLFFLHFFQKLLASFLFFYLIEPSRYSPSSLLCRFPFCRQKASLFSPFLGYPFPAVTRLSAIVTKTSLLPLPSDTPP